MEAVVVIKLDPVLRGVVADPHVGMLVVLGLLDAVVHVVTLLAVPVVVVVVEPVLAAAQLSRIAINCPHNPFCLKYTFESCTLSPCVPGPTSPTNMYNVQPVPEICRTSRDFP